jgi:preprotein translocase subunit YajC
MFESIAYAATSAATGPEVNPLLSFMPFVLVFIIFYFLLIRPQHQRQKELQKTIESIKKGDRVVTSGGLIGTVTSLQNDYVVLKVGDNENTKIEILKSAITGLRN